MPTIAIIGASSNREKYAHKALHAWLNAGWTVYPVNPNETEIEGLTVYPAITDIPAEVDVATMYVLPGLGLKLADGIIAKGVREVYLNPGTSSPELVAKLRDAGIEVIEACSIIASRSRPADGEQV